MGGPIKQFPQQQEPYPEFPAPRPGYPSDRQPAMGGMPTGKGIFRNTGRKSEPTMPPPAGKPGTSNEETATAIQKLWRKLFGEELPSGRDEEEVQGMRRGRDLEDRPAPARPAPVRKPSMFDDIRPSPQ